MLFHIENREKSSFAYEVNHNFIEYHEYLEDNKDQAGPTLDGAAAEEVKKADQEKLSYYYKSL